MSRAKTRRPGTRSGRRANSVADEIPDDLADAAEAALDDLITNAGDMPYRDPAPAPAPKKAPPPPPRAKSTVLELGEAQRKRPRAPDREPTFGRNSQFERDDGHAFGQPLIPNTPAAPAADLADSLSALELEDADATTEPAQVPEPEPEPDPEEESDEPRVLRFAVFEEADHLAAARSAIVAAGHSVAVNASSQSGAAKITDAIVDGKVDAVLVGLPGGEAIVAAALALEPRRPIVIAAYTGKATSAIKRGIAAGADLAVVRPHDADR